MNDELRDIKPLLDIPDSSYTIFMVFALFVSIIILTLLFIFIKKLLSNRKKDMKRVYFRRLKNVDWSNSKKAAYEVTYFGRFLAKEPRVEQIYNQLVNMLKPYKYKREVPPVNEETLRHYNLLVHIIDETL